MALVPSLIFVIGFITFRVIFSATLGPIVWIILPETTDPEIVGYAAMLNWFAAALVSFSFPIVVEKFGGPEYMFAFLAVLMLAGFYINKKILVETKGKS